MTQCFTFEVVMTVQVLAETLEEAEERVDTQGGYLSDRSKKLVAATKLVEPVKLQEVSKIKKPKA